MSDRANLTELETLALPATINISDGHARQLLSPAQTDIVDHLSELFHEAALIPYPELEERAQTAFFQALGQLTSPVGSGRILTAYASSVAMEILARALMCSARSIGVVHPTFDNIPDILRGLRLDLVPIDERFLAAGDVAAVFRDAPDCVFVTTPNNPTGTVVPAASLLAIAQACERRGAILVLDTSFRGFDSRAQYDHYAVLDRAGCRYVVIEDTGKLWPTLDLKVGFVAFSEDIGLPIQRVHSNILLNVSPFILALVERFAADAAGGGLDLLQAGIARNRDRVRETLAQSPLVSFPDPDSRVSVERIGLDWAGSAAEVWGLLRDRDVHVLPCGPFYWAAPAAGERFVRIALARPPDVIDAAAAVLSSVVDSRA